jgi:hypothetical protein
MIPEAPPSPDEMVASTLEDIACTCPCKDPIPDTKATAEVAYTTLVDQQMVPLERMEDTTPDLLPWDDLPPMRHLRQPKDACVAILLSSEYPPSAASCPFLALEETLDASLLADPSKRLPDVCTCLIEDQKSACP